jgi:hypothetical protein
VPGVAQADRVDNVQAGRALKPALICFLNFSDLVQIIASFKNLHMIHLT